MFWMLKFHFIFALMPDLLWHSPLIHSPCLFLGQALSNTKYVPLHLHHHKCTAPLKIKTTLPIQNADYNTTFTRRINRKNDSCKIYRTQFNSLICEEPWNAFDKRSILLATQSLQDVLITHSWSCAHFVIFFFFFNGLMRNGSGQCSLSVTRYLWAAHQRT